MDRYTVDAHSYTNDHRVTMAYFLWSDIDTNQVEVTNYSLGTYTLDDVILAIF